MPNTYKDLIKADFQNIHANTNENGFSATLHNYGVSDSTITGVWASADESGLQGPNLNDQYGRREIRARLFATSVDSNIVTAADARRCSSLTIDGEIWQCIRIESRDSAKQIVFLRRDEKVTTKQPHTRP